MTACRRDDQAEAVSDEGTGDQKMASLNVRINGKGAARIQDNGRYGHLKDAAREVWWINTQGHPMILINTRMAVSEKCSVTHKSPVGHGVMSSGSPNVQYGGAVMTMLEFDHANALKMLDDMIESLERWDAADRAKFKRWFGTDSEQARQAMLKKFRASRDSLRDAKFKTVDLPGSKYAYVRPHGHTIHLTQKYWMMDDRFRAATLVHESSHWNRTGDTNDDKNDDQEMGPQDLQDWARDSPTGAMRHAPNWDGYAADGSDLDNGSWRDK